MGRAARSKRFAPSHLAFFLLACGQAMMAVPLWGAEYFGWLSSLSAGAPSLHHAHEMLLGYAVAVIGGFLFTRQHWPGLAAAILAWLAGRAASFAEPSLPMAGAALAFPAFLAVLAGWPFAKAAKTSRNLAFAPVLFSFLVAETLYQAGRLGLVAAGEPRAIGLALDMTVTMLLVMGGRLIPAAMSGIVRAQGDTMADRNGPRLEALVLAAMATAAACHLADQPSWAVAGWAVAGVASAVRLSRWRFRAAMGIPSLWPLHAGYLFLCAGLTMAAWGSVTGWWTSVSAIHLATIGGLGAITVTMMVRTAMLRDRLSRTYPRPAVAAVILLLVAALARTANAWAPGLLLPIAILAWSIAFALTGWTLVTLKGRPPAGPGL